MIFPIHYVLMNPTGNMTILVETEIPEKMQANVAAKLMRQEPTAEQVGFLSQSKDNAISIRMAGGEFCGNAAMSAAVYHGMIKGVSQETVSVSFSGTDHPVMVKIFSEQDGNWTGIVDMPHPYSIQEIPFSCGKSYPVVQFEGIAHIILEEDLPCSSAEKMAVKWCEELGVKALGLMFLNRHDQYLTPLVYVPAADTLFWESTCASGTTAIGSWLAKTTGSEISLKLKQPGGILEIHAQPDGILQLMGRVSCLYEKTVSIDY